MTRSDGVSGSLRKETREPVLGVWVFIDIMVWYTCLLRHPGTGQSKDRVQVSVTVTYSLEPEGLSVRVLSDSGLECAHDGLTWAFLRWYLSFWRLQRNH